MSKETYQFSIEDFQNNVEAARNYLIRKYVEDLMILAGATINDGNVVEIIVNDAYMELLTRRKEFNKEDEIKSFLYKKVNEGSKNFLKDE